MNNKHEEPGQIMPVTALMMVVFVAIASFSINASYAYYQHSRMQADLDTATKYAADRGCRSNPSTPSGMSFASPSTGPYAGQLGFCEGSYQMDPGSLFGKVLRFPFHLSVQAVALHGGSTVPYFSMLGLDTDSTVCSIQFGGNGTVSITGDAYSNSSKLYIYPSSCVSGNPSVTFNSPSTYINAHPALVDPFDVAVPTSGVSAISHNCPSGGSGCHITCLSSYTIPAGATYYQPNDPSGVAELTTNVKTTGSQIAVYLPYCSGTTPIPGVYLVDRAINPTGGEIDSQDSVFILSSASTSNIQVSGGNINWNSPTSGPYAGYALYESDQCTPTIDMKFNGSGTVTINGLVDVSCGTLELNGGAAYNINGSLIGYTVTFGGSSSGSAVIKAPPIPPTRGAFLVQ